MITVITESIYGGYQEVHEFATIPEAVAWIEKFDEVFDERFARIVAKETK